MHKIQYQEVHVTSKTRQGVPAVRTMAPGADRAPRVKGDTRDPKSQYFKGEKE